MSHIIFTPPYDASLLKYLYRNQVILEDYLYLYYTLNEASDATVAIDETTNNLDGAYISMFPGASGLITGGSTAATFSSSAVLIDPAADLVVASASHDHFAIEAWVNTSSLSGTQTIYQEWALFGRNVSHFYITSAGAVAYQHYSGSSYTTTTADSLISTDTTYHLAMVKESGTVKIYINGVEKGSGSVVGITNWGVSNKNIGRHEVSTGVYSNYFTGVIDEFAIYAKNTVGAPLSVTNIQNHFDLGTA